LLVVDLLLLASKAGLQGDVRSFLHLQAELDQAADGSLFRVFTTNEHARAFGTDRFVVGMSVFDGEDLSWPVCRPLIVLSDDESASDNEAPDRERMPVLSLCRTRL